MEKQFAVYIITNKPRGTLYIGVTSHLVQRIFQHREKLMDGFSKKYNLHRLVYYELHTNADAAITREKRLKEWQRQWKIDLIESTNPTWKDLWDSLLGDRSRDHVAG